MLISAVLMRLWSGSAIALTIYLVFFSIYSVYAYYRIYQFLKENNPERYDWLKGKDIFGSDIDYNKRITIKDRRDEWLYSKMDTEYHVIAKLKNGIRTGGRLAELGLIYMFLSVILGILGKIQGII